MEKRLLLQRMVFSLENMQKYAAVLSPRRSRGTG